MGEPLLVQLFVASSIPVIKILIICAIGAFCARKGLLTPEGRRVLGALSFLVFNPALIFVKLASTLTPSRLLHWWPLVLNTGISTVVGLGLGYLGARLARPPHSLRPHTVVAIALGNLGNLPLVIVSTLATSSAEVLHGIPVDRAEDLAVSYVVVGLLIPVIAHATIGFSMLRKPDAAELPEAADAGDRHDGEGEGDEAQTAAAMTEVAEGDAAAATRRRLSRQVEGGEDERWADGVAVVVDAGEYQKRPLLADHRAAGLAASSSGGKGCTATAEMMPWADRRVSGGGGDDGGGRRVNGSGGGGGDGRRRPARISANGGAESVIPHLSSSEACEKDVDSFRRLPTPSPPPPQQQQLRLTAGGQASPFSLQLRARTSSSGVQAGTRAEDAVRHYGFAVDRQGTADGDPLLELPPPPPSLPLRSSMRPPPPQQQHLPLAGRSGSLSLETELELGILHGTAAVPGSAERAKVQEATAGPAAAAAAARTSASGCGTPGRSSRPAPGGRRRRPLLPLLERRPRIDYLAVGRQVLREVTSPPLLAILLSVPVGCIAPLQRAFFGGEGGDRDAAPLGLLTDCLSMLGDCTIPAILVLLGATLANGPGAARVPLRVIGLVNATRLALLPLLGLGLVMGAYAAHVFEAPDPIYLLVLLIQNTAPTAIMVHTMASVQCNRSEEVSSILFWGYIASIAVIPLWLTLFLYVVKQQFRYVDGEGAGDAAAVAFASSFSG